MRMWIGKILLLVAVVILTAHNFIPHDHDLVVIAAHHDHDHDEEGDGDEHDIFSLNILSHVYTQQAAQCELTKQVTVDVPVAMPLIVAAANAHNEYFWINRCSYSLRHEFPPPELRCSSFGFCGPPLLV